MNIAKIKLYSLYLLYSASKSISTFGSKINMGVFCVSLIQFFFKVELFINDHPTPFKFKF